MRLGFGPGSGEIHTLLGEAGRQVLAVTELVERRFVEWPNGPTQDEVKELEHEADRAVSELLRQTNSLFVTPYDRDDLVTLAFAIDDVADEAESAVELLGLYGVAMPTKQSFQLCSLLVGHHVEVDTNPRDVRHFHNCRGDVLGDAIAQRAALRREVDAHVDRAVIGDGHRLHHAQIGDRPVDLGVGNGRQRGVNGRCDSLSV